MVHMRHLLTDTQLIYLSRMIAICFKQELNSHQFNLDMIHWEFNNHCLIGIQVKLNQRVSSSYLISISNILQVKTFMMEMELMFILIGQGIYLIMYFFLKSLLLQSIKTFKILQLHKEDLQVQIIQLEEIHFMALNLKSEGEDLTQHYYQWSVLKQQIDQTNNLDLLDTHSFHYLWKKKIECQLLILIIKDILCIKAIIRCLYIVKSLNNKLHLHMKTCNYISNIILYSINLKKIPTTSMLLRVFKAPRGPNNEVLSLNNVPEDRWQDSGVLLQAPVYQEGLYSMFLYNLIHIYRQLILLEFCSCIRII